MVIKSPLDEKQKEKYIGIIQAQLNLDILFCYLINLIATNRGFNTTYCTRLKKYRFFKNLFEDYDGYGKLAKNSIPMYIIEYFTDKK